MDSISKSIKIYYDNFVIIFFSKNNRYSNKSKHVELEYHAVREGVQFQKVSFKHIGIDMLIAGPFTKALTPKKFKNMFILWILQMLYNCFWTYNNRISCSLVHILWDNG